MNLEMDLGQQTLCIWVLLALMFSNMLYQRRTRSVNVRFTATAQLLGALALQLLAGANPARWGDTERTAILWCSVGLTLLSAVGLLVSLLFDINRRGIPSLALELLVVCVPHWLYGLFSAVTGEGYQLTQAMTISLLLGWVLGQRNALMEIRRRLHETEQMQMTLLQEQMRPHFIFNSLSSIRQLCAADPALAVQSLDDFAGYLRKNLDALSSARMIPFQKELEHIEQYAALEKLNPSQRFEMVYDLAVLDFAVPALSIQTLVENAIRHGVRSRPADAPDGAMVILQTEQMGEAVRIVVEDNGPGFSRGLTEKQTQHVAHGLDNVRRRLESQCNGSLTVHSGPTGTRLVILIPYRRAEQ